MQILTGPRSLRPRDAVAVIGEVLGIEIGVDELTREQALVLARDDGRMPRPVLETLLDAGAASVGRTAPITNAVERITGHPPRPFRSWVETHRTDFEPR